MRTLEEVQASDHGIEAEPSGINCWAVSEYKPKCRVGVSVLCYIHWTLDSRRRGGARGSVVSGRPSLGLCLNLTWCFISLVL